MFCPHCFRGAGSEILRAGGSFYILHFPLLLPHGRGGGGGKAPGTPAAGEKPLLVYFNLRGRAEARGCLFSPIFLHVFALSHPSSF